MYSLRQVKKVVHNFFIESFSLNNIKSACKVDINSGNTEELVTNFKTDERNKKYIL